MRATARWLMAMMGLLAVLSAARIAIAADAGGEAPPPVATEVPGIADEVAAIREALDGRDRGEAVSDAARRQAEGAGRDDRRRGGGKEPAEPPAEGGGGK